MTAQQFVTEMTRVIRNTDLDDPVQFAAFRQVAEERIESYAQQQADLQSVEFVKWCRVYAIQYPACYSYEDLLTKFKESKP